MTPFRSNSCIYLFSLLTLCAVSRAQLPTARLTAIFPPGAKTGSTVDVTVSGSDLDDAAEIRFSHPGIVAKLANASDSSVERKFSVWVSADVPVGTYEAWVVGRFGFSNPRAFVVGEQPEVLASNAVLSVTGMDMALGSIVNGRCSQTGIDRYILPVKQGQRVLIECEAQGIDSRMIPVMALTTADGREVGRSRRGGLIDFTSPTDQTCSLAVHDILYRGGPEYIYRLSAGAGPHLDAIFPPAGLPGSTGKYTLYGRNLPGGKPSDLHAADGAAMEQLEVDIPLPADFSTPPATDAALLLGSAGAGVDAMAWRLKTEAGTSNPVLIGAARAPVIVEQEPNDSAETAQKLSLPCEVAGQFYPHGDRDVFTFNANKGDVYWIEIFSQRFGQPTSPELLVQRVTKTPNRPEQVSDVQDLGGPDMQPMGKRGGGAGAGFTAPSRDAQYRLEVTEPGAYRVTVRDLFNESKDNAALTYRLSIHKESPDFRLLATAAPVPDPKNNNAAIEPNIASPFLRKGGVVPIRVNLFRQDGFDSEVKVEVEGLPPGVHCDPARIPSGESSATLLLCADENVEGWTGTPRIIGKAGAGEEEQTHAAQFGAVIWPSVVANGATAERGMARLTQGMPLAVSADEAEPISIALGQSEFEEKADGKIHVPVNVKRRVELKQPLKLQAVGLPKSVQKLELTIGPDAQNGTLDWDLSQQKLPPGTYTFYLQTQTQVKSGGNKAPSGKAKGKKRDSKDAQAMFYSSQITVKVLAK